MKFTFTQHALQQIFKRGISINQVKKAMSCVICKSGNLNVGKATVTLERDGSVVVIKEVPAKVCENCGHYYLEEEMASQVYEIAEETMKKGVEIEVRHLIQTV